MVLLGAKSAGISPLGATATTRPAATATSMIASAPMLGSITCPPEINTRIVFPLWANSRQALLLDDARILITAMRTAIPNVT